MNETIVALIRCTAALSAGMIMGGCGSSDAALPAGDAGPAISTVVMAAPILLDANAGPCTEPHTVCLTVEMPDPVVMGPVTHLAVGYYKAVPVMTPAEARGVLEAPTLSAGQVFRLKAPDGSLTGGLYPVVLVYMQGGGDIIAVDNLDYTAEATQTYEFTGAALNVPETLRLIYGI